MNNDNSILLIDPNFDPTNVVTCKLLVKIGLDSFSYAIVNNANQQVSAVYDEQECNNSQLNLTERFKNDVYLTLPYHETSVAIFTKEEISIPNDIFDDNSVDLHQKFLNTKAAVNLHQQNHFNFTTISALPKGINELISKWLSNAKIYQQNAGLLALAEDIKDSKLLLDFTAQSFTALYVKDEQIIFQQCYEIANTEELNYYILLLTSQLNLNSNDTSILLSGIIHQDDDQYNCLAKYFNEIEFNQVNTELNLQILEDMPAHYYTNLLAIYQCV